jgi:hypothetical protein
LLLKRLPLAFVLCFSADNCVVLPLQIVKFILSQRAIIETILHAGERGTQLAVNTGPVGCTNLIVIAVIPAITTVASAIVPAVVIIVITVVVVIGSIRVEIIGGTS